MSETDDLFDADYNFAEKKTLPNRVREKRTDRHQKTLSKMKDNFKWSNDFEKALKNQLI